MTNTRRLTVICSSLLRADFTVAVKNRRSLFVSLAMPFPLILSTRSAQAREHFGGALAVGLAIAYTLLATGIFGYGLAMARDRELGVFRRLRVTPEPGWAILASRLAAQAATGLVISVVVVIAGTRVDSLPMSAGQYARVLAVCVLGDAVFLAIGLALVGLVRSASTVNAAGRVLFVVLVLLSLLGQNGVLGEAWATIAPWLPVGAVMTLLAGAYNLATWGGRDLQALLACAAYIAVLAAIGIGRSPRRCCRP